MAAAKTKPYLSIIIPAYNEEARLPSALEKIDAFLKTAPYASEVLVVENGSQDRTLELALNFQNQMPNLRVLKEMQRGKGLAVRTGMLAAHGNYRFFCDVDLSMPIEQVSRFLPPAHNPLDVAIGSREAPGSIRYNEPQYRHFTGRVFNTIVRWLALPGLQDTQCGFKCFPDEVAERVFPLQTMTGWAFDVEVLFIARRMGYRVVEVPIDWYFNADSRVSVLKDSLRMAADLLTIRRNAWQGRYDEPVRST